jgi:inner membrane protease subunit 1
MTDRPHHTQEIRFDINRNLILGVAVLTPFGLLWAMRAGWVAVRRVEVVGESMRPALDKGDRLLVIGVVGVARLWPTRAGQIVAVRDPRSRDRLMVKRVSSVNGSWVDVRGDNPDASTDSRHFGLVPRRNVVGRVVYRYWPRERSGWLPGSAVP